MSPIKKHRNISNHQEMEHRRRKPNIPELVYKFLIANEAFDGNEHCLVNKCRCCDQGKHHKVIDSISTSTIGKSIDYRVRQRWHKDIGRISKLYNVNQCPISKNQPISYLQKCMDRKTTKEATKYMKKALNFGVESGYLIPSNSTYRILCVSSDLMKSDSRRNNISICDMILCKNRDIPTRLKDSQKQKRRQTRQGRYRRDQRLRSASRTRHKSRMRKKRRSRSCSRRRRRYSSPQNTEEVTDDEADDYEMNENDPKSNIHTDDVEKKSKTIRLNQGNEEQSTKKVKEDGSDLSIDENEINHENEEKNIDITKS
ncbi:hypothetical protein ALC60_02856 [Trachymyrmex zeteki]|uniref:Uncharacterized protein n=1 Tax=Mycetomoellerius zeteki TaxID=64791 RepID=A0A151XCN4_9HYME|nr:PREDICTED: uncharacterized protein LOC108732134 [Trachymyrmex zeteki]KYQ58124.1 hypothetical protein ALC60_02856 [Trachymyrmex zeteki]